MDEEQVLIAELKEKLSKALDESDLAKARFYSLMISEINDKNNFHLNAEKRKSRERALAKQKMINKKTYSLIRLFMFIILLQIIAVAVLIILRSV